MYQSFVNSIILNRDKDYYLICVILSASFGNNVIKLLFRLFTSFPAYFSVDGLRYSYNSVLRLVVVVYSILLSSTFDYWNGCGSFPSSKTPTNLSCIWATTITACNYFHIDDLN